MSADKLPETTSENSSEKSVEGSRDKKELFSKLFRVQYPMSQEAPVPKVDEADLSDRAYRQWIDELIKKHEDEL
jgi:hypothetical protein